MDTAAASALAVVGIIGAAMLGFAWYRVRLGTLEMAQFTRTAAAVFAVYAVLFVAALSRLSILFVPPVLIMGAGLMLSRGRVKVGNQDVSFIGKLALLTGIGALVIAVVRVATGA